MTKKLFSAISWILHPIFMPILGIYIILSVSHLSLMPYEGKRAILTVVAATTILFPASMLLLLYYQRKITNITISERKERLLPMFSSIVFYYFGYYTLHKFSAPIFLQQFLISTLVCLLLSSIINIKWKISIHMVGIGGILGLLSVMSYLLHLQNANLLILIIFFAGLIGTARLFLKQHNYLQIYAGFTLGYLITFFTIVLLNLL